MSVGFSVIEDFILELEGLRDDNLLAYFLVVNKPEVDKLKELLTQKGNKATLDDLDSGSSDER